VASEQALLLIADISGYTEYMRAHRLSLAHAEANTARLLEKVIDAAHGFELVEIEGDAAFLSRRANADDPKATVAATTRAVVSMHRAFHLERQHVTTYLCPCDGCVQADNLKLKFVAHIGEVATQTIKHRRTLVGIDVILVHRLLKNAVQVPEYVLFSEELYRAADGTLLDHAHEIWQDLEGIGPVRTYFVNVDDLAESIPELPDPPVLRRVGRTVGVVGRGLPYMLGLRRPRRIGSAH
jgi:class 3 adenylate cyclase